MQRKLFIPGMSMMSLGIQEQTLTTNTGAPVGDNQHSKTIGNNGQVLLEDIHLIEKLAAFD